MGAELIRFADRMVKGGGEDLVQQVALKLLSREAPLDVAEGRTYLVVAVRMAAFDVIRGRGAAKHIGLTVEPAAQQATEGSEAGALAASKEIESALEAFKPALRDEIRDIVMMHYVGGMSQAEVAGLFGLTENAVKQRIRRFREALKARQG